jgi:hypothetical protein
MTLFKNTDAVVNQLERVFLLVAELQNRLEEVDIPASKTAWQLLRDWLDGQVPSEYEALFNGVLSHLEVGTEAEFKVLLKSVWDELESSLIDQLPEKLQPLAERMGELCAEAGEVSIGWVLDKSASAETPGLNGVPLSLTLTSNAALTCQTLPDSDLPGFAEGAFGADSTVYPRAVTTSSFSVSVDASTTAVLPFNYGSLFLGANADLGLDLSVYRTHAKGKRWVSAVVDDFNNMPDPFTAESLLAALQTGSGQGAFHGYKCSIGRGMAFDANLQVAAPSRILTGSLAEFGFNLGYQLEVKSPVDLLVYRFNKENQEWLRVSYQYQRSNSEALNAQLGVALNVQDKAAAAANLLSEQLEDAEELITLLQGEALTKQYITDPVFSALLALDDSSEWASIVGTLKGELQSTALATSWKNQIEAGIGKAGQSAQQDLLDIASARLTDLISKNVSDAMITTYLLEKVPEFSEALASGVIKQVTKQANQLLQDLKVSDRVSQLALAIGKAGAQIDTGAANIANQIDAVVQPVVDILKNYQTLLGNLKKYLDVAAAANIQISLSYHSKRSQTDTNLLSVDIRTDAIARYLPELNQLLKGKVRPMLKAAKADSAALTLNKAQFTRLIESERGTGASLALVDFTLGKEKLLTQSVEWLVNEATGEITVGTKATVRARAFILGNGRTATVSNLSTLGNRQIPVTSLAIGRIRTDEQLTRVELEKTLKALVAFDLISSEDQTQVLTLANNSVFKGKSKVSNTSLNLSVSFSDEQVQTIFNNLAQQEDGVPKALEVVSRNAYEFGFIKADQIDHLQEESGQYKKYATSGVELVRNYYVEGFKLGHSPKRYTMIGQHRTNSSKQRETSEIMNAVYNLCKNYVQLDQALSAMAEIHRQDPNTVSADWYEEKQKEVLDGFSGWVKVDWTDTFMDRINKQWKALDYEAIDSLLLLLIATLVDLADADINDLILVFSLSQTRDGKSILIPLLA